MQLKLSFQGRSTQNGARRSASPLVREAGAGAVSVREPAAPKGLAQWLLDQFAKRRGTQPQRRLVVLETMALGPKRNLTLVECDGRQFLVGGGVDTVSTIVALAAPATDTRLPKTPAENVAANKIAENAELPKALTGAERPPSQVVDEILAALRDMGPVASGFPTSDLTRRAAQHTGVREWA